MEQIRIDERERERGWEGGRERASELSRGVRHSRVRDLAAGSDYRDERSLTIRDIAFPSRDSVSFARSRPVSFYRKEYVGAYG